MKRAKQYEIAERANIAAVYLSQIVTGRRRPSWRIAKRLAAITKTRRDIWMDQETDKMKKAIRNVRPFK